MRPSREIREVYLYREAVDFRKGINGLTVLVESELRLDVFSGLLFVFINQGQSSIKILYWESSGFCLWQKRLEKARFNWPQHLTQGNKIILNGEELNWLLDGFNLKHWRPHASLSYTHSF